MEAGPGTWHACQDTNLPRNALSGILLTHYHSDHIGDLAEVTTGSWMQNAPKRDGPLPIYGGPGIDQIAAGVNTMNGTCFVQKSQATTSKPSTHVETPSYLHSRCL